MPESRPHFKFERAFAGIVAGVDEVGRGPLAGPVVAAAVILPRKLSRYVYYSNRLSL
jgi:ribonuclease HII